MHKKNKSGLLFAFALLTVCVSHTAAIGAEAPTYDCTALETKEHMLSMTQALFAPSPIASPEEFKKSFIEKKDAEAALGDPDASSCASIFSDGTLDEGWKSAVDDVRNLDVPINFSSLQGAAIQAAINAMKEKLREQSQKMMDKIGEDICKKMSSEYLEGLALKETNKAFGTTSQSLRVSAFADSLTADAMEDAPKNVKLLMSDSAMNQEVRESSEKELRTVRKKMWDKF